MDPQDYPAEYLPADWQPPAAPPVTHANYPKAAALARQKVNDATPPSSQPAAPRPAAAHQPEPQFDTFQLPVPAPSSNSTKPPKPTLPPHPALATEPTLIMPSTAPAAAPQQPKPVFQTLPIAKTLLGGAASARQIGSWAKTKSVQALGRLKSSDRAEFKKRLKPFMGAVVVGLLIFGVFNSQLLLGQLKFLISPGADNAATVLVADQSVPPDPIIIIPKINVNVPVVYDEPSYDEKRVQAALERGVVHYGNTGLPGQIGNNVIVGHSSNNWWAGGKYKFAFVLLNKLEAGDTFTLHFKSTRYVYEVFNKQIIEPNDIGVLSQNYPDPVTTLITCDPPGTAWKRLIIQGKQISPSPGETKVASAANVPKAIDSPLPGYGQSFWERIANWFQ